jgi:crotonobetainyl-CoA:carnitine CoA-transferase CaiB-like acyl-CoA transferase
MPDQGYDFMAQAVGGLMHITGAAGGRAQKVGVAITDVMTGVLSAGAVCVACDYTPTLPSTPQNRCAALQHRSSCGDQGLGQHIEASLLETQVFSLANIASNWLTAGQEAQRLGNAHPSIVPYQTFEAADCEFAVGAGNNKQVHDADAR